jgi:hypothetical protein
VEPADDAAEPYAFVLGGNANTLAFTSSLVPENRQIAAWLVPLAWTPIGVVLGENWQRVNVAADNLAAWGDTTFAPDDERAFVSSARDLEMLARIGWSAPVPSELNEGTLVNPDDLPEDLLEAFAHPAETLVQCAICRRSCVRDDFVWNERRLCAWDFHATVFGKRGPWHAEPYEERHFATLPSCKYVAHPLLEDIGVDAIMALDGIDSELAHRIINEVIAADPTRAHLAVQTLGGFTVLRERNTTGVES